jgi:hypothetical protein
MWRPASDNASIIHFAICLASSGSIRFSWWSLCASQIAVAIIEFTWCRSFKRFSSQSASARKVSLWAILSRQLKCYHACERWRGMDALHFDAGKAIDPLVWNNLLQGDITGVACSMKLARTHELERNRSAWRNGDRHNIRRCRLFLLGSPALDVRAVGSWTAPICVARTST